jgi:hypothetical protein
MDPSDSLEIRLNQGHKDGPNTAFTLYQMQRARKKRRWKSINTDDHIFAFQALFSWFARPTPSAIM